MAYNPTYAGSPAECSYPAAMGPAGMLGVFFLYPRPTGPFPPPHHKTTGPILPDLRL